ncbi:MAG: hypothetical protein AB7E47_10175 [Desulfovibrionaceae bacterium]
MHVSHTPSRVSRALKGVTALGIFCLVLAALPSTARAAAETIQVTRTYVLGDGQSKAEARGLCFLEAKRDIMEKAGTWMESYTASQASALSRDEVKTFSGAVVKAEVVREELSVVGQSFAVTLTVSAVIDPEAVGATLARLAADGEARARLMQRQERVADLENRALAPQPGDAAAPRVDAGGTVRLANPLDAYASAASGQAGPRVRVFQELRELEAARDAVLADMARASRDAAAAARKGMTPADVEGMLGAPRTVKRADAAGAAYVCANYGRTWVVYRDGLVACVRKRLEFLKEYGSDCHCAGFAANFIER